MWLLTTRGFYSVISHGDDPTMVLVRAHEQEDLLALRDLTPGIEPGWDPSVDSMWRAEIPRDEWAHVIAAIADEIDYDDFTNVISTWQADIAG